MTLMVHRLHPVRAPLIIVGNDTAGRRMAYYFRRQGRTVSAFVADEGYIHAPVLDGVPVFPIEQIETRLAPDDHEAFVAIGPSRMNRVREEKCAQMERLGYPLTHYVSESAILWDGLEPKANTRIGERSLCQPFVQLGRNVSVASACVIGHDTIVGDHVFIASGVIIGGNVTIGDHAFIGTGSVIRSKVHVGPRCVIGAGVTLLESTAPDSVYANMSARKLPITSADIQF
jgi:sugar O-acyltransferase (sialic acid O-acetyltransferase NeuD family)